MDDRVAGVAASASPKGRADKAARIRDVAVEFEAVFLAEVLRGMTGGLGPDAPFAKEPFGSLLIDEYARLIAKSGGVGIATATQRELLRLQETQP
jgi:Rod binding domain-containing protein